jgi:hypothetical protein
MKDKSNQDLEKIINDSKKLRMSARMPEPSVNIENERRKSLSKFSNQNKKMDEKERKEI